MNFEFPFQQQPAVLRGPRIERRRGHTARRAVEETERSACRVAQDGPARCRSALALRPPIQRGRRRTLEPIASSPANIRA